MRQYYVYTMASHARALYTGVTNSLLRRVSQHKQKALQGFTASYSIDQLVYFEATSDVHMAIAREKQIKSWRREKKIALIESMNPLWQDLAFLL